MPSRANLPCFPATMTWREWNCTHSSGTRTAKSSTGKHLLNIRMPMGQLGLLFGRYIPKNEDPFTIYKRPGLNVDKRHSDDHQVSA